MLERRLSRLQDRFFPEGNGLLSQAWKVALFMWLLGMIATPIVVWSFGDTYFPLLASVVVLAHLTASLIAFSFNNLITRVIGVSFTVIVLTWGIELVGLSSGFPFGVYQYASLLQPQAAGVPLIIPLAWLMMLIPSWGIADLILGAHRHPLAFAMLAGLAFTAWDFFLDPQMVAYGLWSWNEPGGFFGIPWMNYFGWWMSASLITLLVRPGRLAHLPLFTIYALTWAFQSVGLGIFWGLPGPALVGFVCMGLFVYWSWKRIS